MNHISILQKYSFIHSFPFLHSFSLTHHFWLTLVRPVTHTQEDNLGTHTEMDNEQERDNGEQTKIDKKRQR